LRHSSPRQTASSRSKRRSSRRRGPVTPRSLPLAAPKKRSSRSKT
jgi:hypothetical protein